MEQTTAERVDGTAGRTGAGAKSGRGERAELHRMAMHKHLCPFGLKARDRLLREGYELEGHPLHTRERTDAFMREHGVETPPQVFIEGRRIGGHDDLRRHLGDALPDENGKTYTRLAVPTALFVGTVGAASVPKAVYIDERDLECACAGGDSNVPLGFVSLTENLAMIGMALWMWAG